MKKLLTIIALCMLTTGIATAQTTTTHSDPENAAIASEEGKCDKKNCCMMKDGKMIYMKDGKEMPLEKEMVMKNGTKCMPDGTCIDKNGKKISMKNGQCCDANGKMCHMGNKKENQEKK
jgi:hypothetical protein